MAFARTSTNEQQMTCNSYVASRGDSTLEHPYVKPPRLYAVASYLRMYFRNQRMEQHDTLKARLHTYVPAEVRGSMPQHMYVCTCDIAECRENKGRYVADSARKFAAQ